MTADMVMPGSDVHTPAMGQIGPFWLPLIFVTPAAVAYTVGVVGLTRRGDSWPLSRCLASAAGFAVLTAALMPPLVTSMNFSLHVIQHLMLAMLAPFLFALGAPVTLALRTLPRTGRRRLLHVLHNRASRVLTFPPTNLVLDIGGMYAYYLSPLFASSHAHPWLHLAVHTHMFFAGCLLSWYLVRRDPMPRRTSTRNTLVMLVLAAGSHDVLAKLMYAHLLPHGGGTPDQIRIGAQIMFYGGEAIDVTLTFAIMLAWYTRAGRQLARDDHRHAIASSYHAVHLTRTNEPQ